MDESQNKILIRRFVDEVENTGNVSSIREFISEDYKEIYEGQSFPIGIQGAIDHVLGIRRVFPDLKITIENQISEGEWVATVYSVTGTFNNEWFNMKPTGKPITFNGVNVDRIKDGKIIEHGGAVNMFESLLNEGVIIKK